MYTSHVRARGLWSAAFVCLLALGLSASAAAQPTVVLRGNVGASFFRAPDGVKRVLHSGVNTGVGAGVHVYRGVAITAHAAYDQFTLNEETARLFDGFQSGDHSFLSGALGVRYTYRNGTDAHPYVSMGVGMYRLKKSNRKVFQEGDGVDRLPQQTSTEAGAHLALGSFFRLDDTYALFLEPRYVFYDVGERLTGTQRYITVRLGVEVRL